MQKAYRKTFKDRINKIKRCIRSTILCIRFPFLLLRDGDSDTPYYNKKIWHYIEDNLPFCTMKIYDDEKEEFGSDYIVTNRWLYIKVMIVKWYYKYPLQWFHCIQEFNWLDDMPEGWRKNFGIQLCKDLRKELIKNHYLFKYRIVQIKEKFGGLRWYDDGAPGKVHEIIEDYASKSYYICINCGKPATKFTTGWICPYCDDCIPEGRPYREIKPTDEVENKI